MTASKRAFDLFWSLLGLALLWPLLLLLALLVRLGSRGPVIFWQTRVGYRGRPFRLWKFRTMVPNAESGGVLLSVAGDPRITRVGRWLRTLKLDELPQLINVVAGQMSLVGPRPEVPKYVARYTEEQRRVLDLVPGITDVASLRYRDEEELLAGTVDPELTYVASIMPEKIRLNLEYAARASRWSDVVVIVKTLFHLAPLRMKRRHAKGYVDADLTQETGAETMSSRSSR